MLKIIANIDTDLELDLGELDSIQLNFNSGLFDFDSLPGSYSLTASLPFTPINNQAFEFAYKRNKVNNDKRDLPCEIFISETLISSGTIVLNKTSTNYSFNIILDSGQFGYKGEDRNLQTFEYGGEQPWVWKDEYTQNDGFTLCPIRNYDLFDNTDPSSGLATYQNPLRQDARSGFATIENTPDLEFEPYAVTPFPFIFYTLQNIFEQLNITILKNVFVTDNELFKVFLYNQYNIVNADEYSTPYYYQLLDTFDLKNHVPNTGINEFLITLKKTFGVHFDFTNDGINIISIKDVFSNNASINIDSIVIDSEEKTNIIPPEEIILGLEASGADLLFSNIPMGDNKPAVELTPVAFTFIKSSEYLFFPIRQELWIANVIYEKPEFLPVNIAPVRKEELAGTNAELKYSTFFNQYGDTDFQRYNLNLNQLDLSSSAKVSHHPLDVLPVVNQKGNHYFNRFETKSSDIRPMIYHGKQSDLLNAPFGSPDFYSPYKGEIIGDLRIRSVHEIIDIYTYEDIVKDNVIMQPEYYYSTLTGRYFLEFIEWKLNRCTFSLKKQINLKYTQINNFDFTSKYRYDGNDYFITSLNTTIKADGSVSKTIITLIPA